MSGPEYESVPGESGDVSHLFESLYDELHVLARREIRDARGSPISASTLLHETYFRLHRGDASMFRDHSHFLAYAARAMRNLVIDFARRNQAQKRGGAYEITALTTSAIGIAEPATAPDLERLADAIDALADLDPALAELVDLKFFCGMTFAQIATLRGVSERTVLRGWRKARILLERSLDGQTLLPS